MSFSNNLYDMMLLRRMTRQDLEEATGIAKQYISALIRGNRQKCTIKVAKKLAKALKCTPGWLLRDYDIGEEEK